MFRSQQFNVNNWGVYDNDNKGDNDVEDNEVILLRRFNLNPNMNE